MENFDFMTITSFEKACERLSINTTLPDTSGIPDEFAKPIIAVYKLMIIFKAINNGWIPDWSNWGQYKYYPWFRVLSSGFGFSYTGYICDHTLTLVGSRLCTNISEKAKYIAKQFEQEYKDAFLIPKN